MIKKCWVCGSTDSLPLKTGNKEVNHFICKNCGLIYIWPIQSKKELEVYYGGEKSTKDQGVELNISEKRLKVMFEGMIKQADYILKNSGYVEKEKGKKVLEIGSSAGHLLQTFKTKGFEVMGVEPSKVVAKYSLKKYKINIINNVFEKVKFNKKFDLVLCIHMLEHVKDPIDFLSKVKKVLNKKGVLYIKVSNVCNPLINLKKFFTLLHFINYSQKTLLDMLALNGFKAIKIDTKGNFIDMFFVKDSKVKLKVDPNEYKRELNFLRKYKRNYFLKLKFLTRPLKGIIRSTMISLLIFFLPFNWIQKIRSKTK